MLVTTVKARAVWISRYRSALDNERGHSVVVDLPPGDGGEDTGATALELAVMAFAGCVTTIFKKVAEKRKLEYSGLIVEMEAEKGEKTVERCEATLRIWTKAAKEEVEKTLKLTEKICPVGLIFQKAGIKTDWKIEIETP